MKTLKKIILSILVVISAMMILPQPVAAEEDFVIEKHVVDMDVHEDGSILITETMDVHFLNTYKHGIYVNIPKKYNMQWEINGSKQYSSYFFPIRNIKVLSSHANTIDSYDDGVQIKIGDPDKYVNEYETYVFRYEIITRDLDLDGMQMLFMNIISGKWQATTNLTEFSIVMPKPFDVSKLQFDSPEGVTSTSKGSLVFTVTGNVISGSYSSPLQEKEALTVLLTLPDNYFVFPDMNTYGLISCAISAVALIAYAVLFFLFGKDDPLIDSVEFHAPAGINSAEVGVIIDGVANDGDVISLLLDWGRRGLINIVDEKTSLKLIKKAEIEETAKGYERHMFNTLFAKKDEVDVNKLKYKFYRTIQHTEAMLDNYFSAKKRQLFTSTSKTLQVILCILSFLPIGLSCVVVSYNYDYDLFIGLFTMIVCAALIIGTSAIMIYMDNKRYMHRWYTKTALYFATAVLFSLAVIILEYLYGRSSVDVLYSIPVICANIAMVIIVRMMKKRTEYGNQLLGQILGLRNFILVAEKDHLAELLDENPYYFYDILPYAYALGLTDIWNEHFKNLTVEPCTWYVCPYDDYSTYHRMHSLESHMTVIERSMTEAPSSSSGGASFSSGGGGGGSSFSGGGFGGSGGGSW